VGDNIDFLTRNTADAFELFAEGKKDRDWLFQQIDDNLNLGLQASAVKQILEDVIRRYNRSDSVQVKRLLALRSELAGM
jgi:hypothetical protein